tara:strand:- start:2421 stop:3275 length:855 start_codon:yes stop_codon:yes gene_type:complete
MVSSNLNMGKGSVVIITGGASGIGLSLGRAMAELGCHVYLVDRQKEVVEKETKRLRDKKLNVKSFELDVRDRDTFIKIVKQINEDEGHIDYFFNNAGIGAGWDVKEDKPEDWDYIIDVNIRGVQNGIHAVYPLMVKQGFGHIINTASMAGLVPSSLTVSYAMTKHAVVGLTVSLHGQAAIHGVRVSALCPGFVETPILEGGVYGKVDREKIKKGTKIFNLPGIISPEELVKRTLPKIKKNKVIIIEPFYMKVYLWLYRFFPNWILDLSRRGWISANRKLNNPLK